MYICKMSIPRQSAYIKSGAKMKSGHLLLLGLSRRSH